MAQHDFVPAWLNFSTPQPAKSPAATFEKHGEHSARGDGRSGVSRRRHNSSDGFFNNGPLRPPTGDGWQQPSLLRHDSVDSAVSKGSHGGLAGWHGGPRGLDHHCHPHHHHQQGRHHKRDRDRDRDRPGGHRQRGSGFHSRKGSSGTSQDKPTSETQEEKLKFVEEDFPSLNPEGPGKPVTQSRPATTPAGVWENPPSAKQAVSKMLVIKKVSKEEPGAAFSAGFASTAQPLPASSNKVPISGPSVYKNLVPKSAATACKTGPWKPNGRETKPGLHFPGRDSAFISPASVTKPVTAVSTPPPTAPKELPSSTTPPIDINPPRLKLMRRGPDRKSDFLRALKDERNGELRLPGSPGTSGEGESSTPDSKEGRLCHENGVSHSLSDSDSEHQLLSSSLEAEHRLLKSMGWQEYPENDDNFLPLTEDELKEFQTKTEQLKKNGFGRNGVLLKTLQFSNWRPHAAQVADDGSESETSSSQTSDDDNT